jgi:hypothetical protein
MGHRRQRTLATRIVALGFIAIGIALVGALSLPAAAQQAPHPTLPLSNAEPTLAQHAPAGVPAGFVVTPFGYFHPSCVRIVGRRDRLLGDGRIERADGAVTPAQRCRFAHYMASGRRIEAGASEPRAATPLLRKPSAPPEADGWLEASWYHDKAPFGGIGASWLVPSAPASDVGQVLYYFPGLEDYENVVSILQPVLGWNGFNDHGWTIASWNCCQGGNADHSVPERVATGDLIVGTISGDCPAGKKCSAWDIATVDRTRGRSTTLKRSSSYGQTFDWAFAGVVEVYGVAACDQYSSNGFVDFNQVSLLDVDKKRLRSVRWAASGLLQANAPACNYGVTVAPTSASLTF